MTPFDRRIRPPTAWPSRRGGRKGRRDKRGDASQPDAPRKPGVDAGVPPVRKAPVARAAEALACLNGGHSWADWAYFERKCGSRRQTLAENSTLNRETTAGWRSLFL